MRLATGKPVQSLGGEVPFIYIFGNAICPSSKAAKLLYVAM